MAPWQINGTDRFADWYGALTESEQDAVIAVVELLAEQGPQLTRPHADRITGSRYHNLKELRPRGDAKNCRVLFILDPRREALLLIGGNKAGQWTTWYRTAIAEAEQLYDEHLTEMGVLGTPDATDETGP